MTHSSEPNQEVPRAEKEIDERDDPANWPDAPWLASRRLVVDPETCGCTDCILGDSVPMDLLDEHQWRKIHLWKSTPRPINRTHLTDIELWSKAHERSKAWI